MIDFAISRTHKFFFRLDWIKKLWHKSSIPDRNYYDGHKIDIHELVNKKKKLRNFLTRCHLKYINI